MARKLAGRKRKAGARTAAGKLVRVTPTISPELLDRRREASGGADPMQPEAGYVLGQLMLAGHLTRQQHDAGIKFRDVASRWASLAQIPPHEITQRVGGQKPETTAAQWVKAKRAYHAARAVMFSLPAFAVERVVMDNLPIDTVRSTMRTTVMDCLIGGLDVLAKHFHIGGRGAAK